MIAKSILEASLKHAHKDYPNESCGLVIVRKGRRKYVPCRNVAANPRMFFEVSPEDFANAEDEGEIVMVVHSHPDMTTEPSIDDLVGCNATGLPWLIVSVPDDNWRVVQPIEKGQPLVGREFIFGVQDCYSLIRDWYEQVRAVTLLDFPREDEFWKKGQNLYIECLPQTGFERVSGEPQPGDILLMQIGADLPNHGAIYLGDDMILHHLHGRLSSREVYGGYYKKHTTHIMRRKQDA